MKVINEMNTTREVNLGDVFQGQGTKDYYMIVTVDGRYGLLNFDDMHVIARRDTLGGMGEYVTSGYTYICSSEDVTMKFGGV